MGEIVIFAVIVAVALVIGYFAAKKEKKRRARVIAWAHSQGFHVESEDSETSFAHLKYFDILRVGHTQTAKLRITGEWVGLPFTIIDIETVTGSGKHRREYSNTVCIIETGLSFPSELKIRPEHFGDRISSAFGGEDINFESEAFSKMFHVSSLDRKFAYDMIHQGMMEYLLNYRSTVIEVEYNAIIVHFKGDAFLDPSYYPELLRHTRQIIELTPAYFIDKSLKGET